MVSSNPELERMFDELRRVGATVVTGASPATIADITSAEVTLGFRLPDEVREFFFEVGEIKITPGFWVFYGVDEALAVTETYRAVFDEARVGAAQVQGSDGPYYPKRFIVLHDRGLHGNLASGTVYDADLDAFLVTAGARWVDRSEAFQVGYSGHLLDELDSIRDRIAQ